ncbi:MAG: hypothetical protein R3F31_01820 [Verrucomicrobiales bacterium]|nr:hypothetical protein [Verrucomicrobiales bacterium]
MSDPTDLNPFARRVSESRVASLLQIIAAPPNARRSPAAGDLEGDFDLWCDGAACKYHTGSALWEFADGTTAMAATPCAWLWVRIFFPDGQNVEVRQAHLD